MIVFKNLNAKYNLYLQMMFKRHPSLQVYKLRYYSIDILRMFDSTIVLRVTNGPGMLNFTFQNLREVALNKSQPVFKPQERFRFADNLLKGGNYFN